MGLNQGEPFQQLTHGSEIPSNATVFIWLREFSKSRNSILDDERIGRALLRVLPENVLVIQRMLVSDIRRTYQMIQRDLNFRSAVIYKITMKKLKKKINISFSLDYP